MAEFNPRNRNQRHDEAPLSWSQRFYDAAQAKRQSSAPCGFRVKESER